MRPSTVLSIALIAVTLSCAYAAGPATWYDCTSAGGIAKITGVTINPNPPAVKANTTVTGHAMLSSPIEAGSTFKVVMYFDGIELFSKSGDVCLDSKIELPLSLGTIFVHGLDCPVAAGATTLTETAYIAINPPSGEYKIQLTASEPSGKEAVCVGIQWDA